MDDELWDVALPSGEVKRMTLDQLDRAFQVGLIHSNTLIREGGTQEWQTLGAVAGLEEEPATEEVATARADAAPASRSSVLPAPAEEDVGRETLAGLGGFLAVAPTGLQGINAARSQTPPVPPAAVAPLPSRNATRPMGSGALGGAAPPALPTNAFAPSRPPPLPAQAFAPSSPPAAMHSAPPAMASRPPPLPPGAFASPPPKPQQAAPIAAAPPAAAPPLRSAPPLRTSAPPLQSAPPLRSAPPLQSAPPPLRTSAPPLPTGAFPGTASQPPLAASQPPATFSAPPAMPPMVHAAVSRGADRATNVLIAAMALLTLVMILQRNGTLFDLMVKLKMEKSYVSLEQSLLGPPSPETPRGVQLIFEPQPVAASTR